MDMHVKNTLPRAGNRLVRNAGVILFLCITLMPQNMTAIAGSLNPEYRTNEIFPAYESFHHPRVQKLRQKYRLDVLIEKEDDEFRRILLLRHWIHSKLRIDDDNPTPVRMDTFEILDAAAQGGRFHCVHASIVLHAVLNSYGYVARRLGVGPGLTGEDFDGHHGTNEVWVNTLAKWVAVDAKYDLHFEKNGLPLSALEIRDELWRNQARDVRPAFGLERLPNDPRMDGPFWGRWATPVIYHWCSWETNTNRFTAYPAAPTSTLVMYSDKIFRKNTWYRDGKPHWAYNTPYLIIVERRDWIYWTPNVIRSKVNRNKDKILIQLISFTPNLKTYQMSSATGEWIDCPDLLKISPADTGERMSFRAMNEFGVAGPVHRIDF
jgi:hypothetical protein